MASKGHPAPMRTVLLLVSLTVLVRGAAMLAAPDALRDDVDRYRAVAENLYHRGVFATLEAPTAYRPPLYPLLLVPAVALGAWSSVGIAALHLALGVGTVLLTWRLGQQARLGGWALVAAVLVACDPILVRQSTLVMTETPAAFFAVAGLVALGGAAQCPSAGRAARAAAESGCGGGDQR
jgi:4-amino-4-deoxy-L-arabinose transferase-like glycosyltransferase